jgi:hypothetical protein
MFMKLLQSDSDVGKGCKCARLASERLGMMRMQLGPLPLASALCVCVKVIS